MEPECFDGVENLSLDVSYDGKKAIFLSNSYVPNHPTVNLQINTFSLDKCGGRPTANSSYWWLFEIKTTYHPWLTSS